MLLIFKYLFYLCNCALCIEHCAFLRIAKLQNSSNLTKREFYFFKEKYSLCNLLINNVKTKTISLLF